MDAYNRDSHLQAISGYGFKNWGGLAISKKASPHCTIHLDFCRLSIIDVYLSRLRRLQNAMSHLAFDHSIWKCVKRVKKVLRTGLPSAHNLQKLPDHGSHVQTGSPGSEQTSDSLTGIELNHSMFPFIFESVCETTTGKMLIIDKKTSQVFLERTVEKVEEHETLCRKLKDSWTSGHFLRGVSRCFQVTAVWCTATDFRTI